MDVEEIHFHPKLSFFLLILVLDVFSTSTSDDEGRRVRSSGTWARPRCKVVAGGGHHLRFGKLHLHRVQLARLRLVQFQIPHPRYCVYQDSLFFYCFIHAAMRHWPVGRGIATIDYHTNVFNT